MFTEQLILKACRDVKRACDLVGVGRPRPNLGLINCAISSFSTFDEVLSSLWATVSSWDQRIYEFEWERSDFL